MSERTTFTPADGHVECGDCSTRYRWDENLLTGEWLWVRDCRKDCRSTNSGGNPRPVLAKGASASSAAPTGARSTGER